eukprot:1160894-Pelagomonas_calceolata.AAC.1
MNMMLKRTDRKSVQQKFGLCHEILIPILEYTSTCDRCDQGGLQDEKHAVFLFGTVEQTEQPNYLAEGETPL